MKMLRAATSVLRASSNAAQLQQCMKISTSESTYLAAAATPQPQTNPDVLYTGVRMILFAFHRIILNDLRRHLFMRISALHQQRMV